MIFATSMNWAEAVTLSVMFMSIAFAVWAGCKYSSKEEKNG